MLSGIAPGGAGIFARDEFSRYTKRAHGVSRAEMPALPGTDFARYLLNRGFRICLMEEEAPAPFASLWLRNISY
jgi:hypothetical protein